MSFKLLGRLALLLLFGASLAACGNTWSGLKQDTGENMEAVGESMNSAGERVQDSGEEDETTR